MRIRPFRADKIKPPKGLAPFTLPASFQPESPVDLEIGCGVGLHPIRYSLQNPNRYLIAIERTSQKFARLSRRLNKHPHIKNLLAVHADATAYLTHCLPSESISRCFIFYPNPYPKNPQARFIRMPFFSEILRVLKPQGQIEICTNEIFYANEILDFYSYWKLRLLSHKRISQDSILQYAGFYPRTHFEKKYLERGETCYQILLQKNGA